MIVIIGSGLATTLLNQSYAIPSPSPGHLVVQNKMAKDPQGNCIGNYSSTYGFSSVDHSFKVALIVDRNTCSVTPQLAWLGQNSIYTNNFIEGVFSDGWLLWMGATYSETVKCPGSVLISPSYATVQYFPGFSVTQFSAPTERCDQIAMTQWTREGPWTGQIQQAFRDQVILGRYEGGCDASGGYYDPNGVFHPGSASPVDCEWVPSVQAVDSLGWTADATQALAPVIAGTYLDVLIRQPI